MLFTCVLVGLSSAPIYAASEEDPLSSSEVPSLVVPEEYKDPVYDKLAAGDVRASYTVSDVYVLLNSALVGESNSSTYSLPRIAYYTWQTWSRLNTTNTRLYDILSALVDGNSSNIPVGPGIRQMLYGLDSQNQDFETIFETSQDTRDLAQLIYSSTQQIHSDGQNNTYYLNQISSNLSSDIPWVNNGTFLGFKSTSDGSYISSSGYLSGKVYFDFQITDATSSYMPGCVRVFLPAINPWESTGIANITDITTVDSNYHLDTFVEPVHNGYYLYIFNLTNFPRNDKFSVKMTCTFDRPAYYTVGSGNVYTLSSSTDHYQYLKTAFYQAQAIASLDSSAYAVNRLADYLADPDKIAAEQASQQVIDDTLDGFTGNGSAAAKTSDTGAMKNVSGSIQSGLDTGAGVSNATNVFDLSSGFWGWFSQENSNYINNPYPAPDVPQLRSSGDEIIDFVSGNDSAVEDLLRGAEW